MSLALSTYVRVRPNPGKCSDALVNRHLWEGSQTVCVSGGQAADGEDTSASSTAAAYGPFSGVLPPQISQAEAHGRLTSELLDSFLHGRTNCTLFAYGQTGSGKTYTLFGPPNCFASDGAGPGPSPAGVALAAEDDFGLCPRAILDVRRAVLSGGAGDSTLFLSAVEVYLEECYDLLRNKVKVPIAGLGSVNKKAGGSFNNQQLGGPARDANGKWVPPILNGKKNPACQQVEVQGCAEVDVLQDEGSLLHVMRVIEANRSGRSHALNERSSRSHCLVTLTMTRIAKDGQKTQTRFLFVDLAGSERIKKTDVLGLGVQEAKNINLSLSSLGRCISALRKGGRDAFVPWRDSALTLLMRQSLSGNCRTALCVCIAEDGAWAQETVSSLRFGITCGSLRTSACAVESSDAKGEASYLQARLAELDAELADLRAKGAHGHVDPSFPRTTAEGFVENFAKLRRAEEELVRSKLAAGAAGGAAQQASLAQAIVNLKGLLIRQITTGLWREPKQAWRAKMGERRGTLRELQRLGGAGGSLALGSALEDDLSCILLYDLTRDFTG